MADPSQSRAPVPFPATLWSEVMAARDPSSPEFRERMNRLIERYWKPVYWSLRLRWKQEPAQAADLAQDFFIQVLDGRAVATADPTLGTFRAYLKKSLDFFMHDAMKISYAQKRGGGRDRLPIDFADGEAPAELADASQDPATAFDRGWAHQVLSDGVTLLLAELERDGKSREAQIFRALDLGEASTRPSLRDLAATLGVSKSEVWKLLADARGRLRAILVRSIREYVSDESELFRELDELFAG